MVQNLSARVDKAYYKAVVKMVKKLYSSCNSINAWDPSTYESYQQCTKEISKSSLKIHHNFKAIESYSVNSIGAMSIQAELDQILEDVEFEPNPWRGLERALTFIKNVSLSSTQTGSCFEIEGCLEITREVIVRLKMIQWGLYGLGQTSAGLYLANHNTMMGPYFGDIGGTNWPHIPLHKKPTALEEDFNQLLTNITFVMSNETLENISILDLPAFGSTIGTLRTDLKKHFNWPIETNHAVLINNPVLNLTNMFMAYKTLVEDWGQHMQLLRKKENASRFTLEMKNNKYLNFTKFIKADMKTFLIAISGNKLSLIHI